MLCIIFLQKVFPGIFQVIISNGMVLSLRYPISRDSFSGRLALPQSGAIPPLVLSFAQAHLCDTPFCYISRDNCAIPHENKHERVFAILSLQVSRDMKSIAAEPLSPGSPQISIREGASSLFGRGPESPEDPYPPIPGVGTG